MRHFLNISKHIGKYPHLVQGAGGNTSVKNKGLLIVKSSGTLLKNIGSKSGYITCFYKPLIAYLRKIKKADAHQEILFDALVEKNMVHHKSFGIPSIETSLHVILPSLYVVHTHSVYTNIFACMEGGEQILKHILGNIPFLFIPYKNPGLSLGLALLKAKKLPPVIILENHGLITHSDNPAEALKLTEQVNNKIISFLKKEKVFTPFKIQKKLSKIPKHLFPDSAVYSQIDFLNYEIFSAHNYILRTIKALHKKPKFIKQKNINFILAMQKEKYRIQKIKNA